MNKNTVLVDKKLLNKFFNNDVNTTFTVKNGAGWVYLLSDNYLYIYNKQFSKFKKYVMFSDTLVCENIEDNKKYTLELTFSKGKLIFVKTDWMVIYE